MKRKLVSLMLAAAVSITALVGCGQSNMTKTEEAAQSNSTTQEAQQNKTTQLDKLAITDVGTIDDKSFKGSGKGLKLCRTKRYFL